MHLKEKYKDYSDLKLTRIIVRRSDYQNLAVEAAQDELRSRNLSSIEIAELESEVRKQLKEEEHKENKVQFNNLFTYLRSISPVKGRSTIGERLFLLVGLVFIISHTQPFYYDLKFIYYNVSGMESLDFPILLVFINILIFPSTIYFYFKRWKIGWILMMLVLSYELSGSITSIVYTIKNASNEIFPNFDLESINYFWLLIPAVLLSAQVIIMMSKSLYQIFGVSTVQRVISFTAGFIM